MSEHETYSCFTHKAPRIDGDAVYSALSRLTSANCAAANAVIKGRWYDTSRNDTCAQRRYGVVTVNPPRTATTEQFITKETTI